MMMAKAAAATTTSQDSESNKDIRALRKKSSKSSVDDAGEMEVSRAETPSQNSRVTTANPRGGAAIASIMAGLKALAERKSTLRKMKKDMVALLIKEEYPDPLKEVALLLHSIDGDSGIGGEAVLRII